MTDNADNAAGITADTAAHNANPARSQLSRRAFLASSGMGLAAVATTAAVTGLGTKLALAAPGNPATGDTLVVVFLRGGADGLSMAPPYGMASYRRLRPTTAIAPPGTANGALPLTSANTEARFPTGLDGVVGLHPSLEPIHDTLWNSGRLAVIPATGMPASESPSRSHFSATRHVQAGSASPNVAGGWLGRMLDVGGFDGPLPGVSTSSRSTVLRGGTGTATIPRLRSFGVEGFAYRSGALDALRVLHDGGDSISVRGRTVLDLVDHLSDVDPALRSGYADDPLGRSFSELASLLKAGLGVQAASIDFGGWDHHGGLGTPGRGPFHDKATQLAAALRAFADDTNQLDEITVVVITEFGRTINENGNGGTDHGRGATHLAMGAGIQGGVFGDDYPDEIRDDPNHGDVPVFTDYRKPLAEVIQRRVGVTNLGAVFPTYRGQGSLGLTR